MKMSRRSTGTPTSSATPPLVCCSPKACLKVISEMLGHSSIVVTADIYGHLLDDARAEAAAAMDRALSG
jgi:integrase